MLWHHGVSALTYLAHVNAMAMFFAKKRGDQKHAADSEHHTIEETGHPEGASTQ